MNVVVTKLDPQNNADGASCLVVFKKGNTNRASELPFARGQRFAQPFINNFALERTRTRLISRTGPSGKRAWIWTREQRLGGFD